MQQKNFSIDQRLRKFWQACKNFDYKSWPFLIYSIGSLVGFLAVITLPEFNFGIKALMAYFIFGFFWLQFITLIRDEFNPPSEILILLAIQFLFILVQNASLTSGAGILFYNFCLFGFAITFSLIIFENREGRLLTLIALIILGYFFLEFHQSELEFLQLIVKVFIFASLIKRLKWLESLSKTECWIYFFTSLFIFRQLFDSAPLDMSAFAGSVPGFKLGIASFAHYLMLAYMLAIAIKIPVVMVYNHAKLARKLWISSLFQSTFPQFFQFALLLLVFQFFISGWQADQVRLAMSDLFERIEENRTPAGIKSYAFRNSDLRYGVQLGEYFLQQDYGAIPAAGIISLERTEFVENDANEKQAMFLFHRSENNRNSVFFVRMDNAFLDYLGSAFVPVIGNGIMGYRYKPYRWEKYIHSLDYWQKDESIRIFPFSLIPYKNEAPLSGQFYRKNQESGDDFSDVRFTIFGQDQIVFGRLFIDFYGSAFTNDGYFAYDVILKPNVAIFSSAVFRNILFLFIAYLLINTLLIKRVVRFGAEINQMIVQKFNQLQGGIREIASGNLGFKVKVEGQDEFVELASHFNTMGDRLNKTIAEAREKGRLEHELKIAREVQLSLLPTKLPQVPGYSVEARFETATEVGGDFYDMLPLGKDKYLFTIGDVSGKGTSAAFYMAQCVSLLRFAPQFTQNVHEITKRLNQYFADPAIDRQMFITAIIGIFDARKHSIEFIRAGHTLPVLVSGDVKIPIRELACTGIGIGLARNSQHLEKTLKPVTARLAPGDMLFCYTDGVVEAQTGQTIEGNDQFFGEERLHSLLTNHRDLAAGKLIDEIVQELTSFYGEAPLADDYTIFVIKRTT
ncbi:MAG: HAMP domain-containing protein [Calditrichaeota bacterium]|nr:MAG: HAMP domain-containing protein [Calditrichota bacterium]